MGDHSRIRVCVVEGNIGSGKTTFMDALAAKGYTVFRENIGEMAPFLESMYNGESRTSDMLQMCVGVQQLRIMRLITETDPKSVKCDASGRPIVFVERWIGSSEQVFIRSAQSCDHIAISTEVSETSTPLSLCALCHVSVRKPA